MHAERSAMAYGNHRDRRDTRPRQGAEERESMHAERSAIVSLSPCATQRPPSNISYQSATGFIRLGNVDFASSTVPHKKALALAICKRVCAVALPRSQKEHMPPSILSIPVSLVPSSFSCALRRNDAMCSSGNCAILYRIPGSIFVSMQPAMLAPYLPLRYRASTDMTSLKAAARSNITETAGGVVLRPNACLQAASAVVASASGFETSLALTLAPALVSAITLVRPFADGRHIDSVARRDWVLLPCKFEGDGLGGGGMAIASAWASASGAADDIGSEAALHDAQSREGRREWQAASSFCAAGRSCSSTSRVPSIASRTVRGDEPAML